MALLLFILKSYHYDTHQKIFPNQKDVRIILTLEGPLLGKLTESVYTYLTTGKLIEQYILQKIENLTI